MLVYIGCVIIIYCEWAGIRTDTEEVEYSKGYRGGSGGWVATAYEPYCGSLLF